MLDRRAFLKASSSTAAMVGAPVLAVAQSWPDAQAAIAISTTPEYLPYARTVARHIENATATSLRTSIEILSAHQDRDFTPNDSAVGVETLHRLTDVHPGFAYFAGLPGHLGLTGEDHFNWIGSRDSQIYWAELQRLCGVRCIIVGRDGGRASVHSTRLQPGLIATVRKALGTKTSVTSSGDPAVDIEAAISLFGSTIAVTASEKMWSDMPSATRSCFRSTAALYRPQHDAHRNKQFAQSRQSETAQAIDRISEAAVAECANHDALTHRINASYFAFRQRQNARALKNNV